MRSKMSDLLDMLVDARELLHDAEVMKFDDEFINACKCEVDYLESEYAKVYVAKLGY